MENKRLAGVGLAVLTLLLLLAASWQLWDTAQSLRTKALARGPEQTAGRFFEALAAGDVDAARRRAGGETLALLFRPRGRTPAAAATCREVRALAVGSGWAEVMVLVETQDASGNPDARWYVASLAREGQEWKVVRVRDSGPRLDGRGRPRPIQTDVGAAREVLAAYLGYLAAGRYRDAGKYLVGMARQGHETGAPYLGQGTLLTGPGPVNLTGLWQDGDLLVARAEYETDGRQVRLVVTFYRTGRGWRIAEAGQI